VLKLTNYGQRHERSVCIVRGSEQRLLLQCYVLRCQCCFIACK